MIIHKDRPSVEGGLFQKDVDNLTKKIKWMAGIILAAVGLFFVFTLSKPFLGFNDGMVSSAASWSTKQIVPMIFWILKKIFFATAPYLFLPIVIYCLVYKFIPNSIIKFFAGLGCVALFYYFSDDLSFSLGSVMNWVKTIFQIYFLLILFMPQELFGIIGGLVSAAGAIVIYIFPDLPTYIDDISAISSMILFIFVYINTLAMVIKRIVAALPFLSPRASRSKTSIAPNA